MSSSAHNINGGAIGGNNTAAIIVGGPVVPNPNSAITETLVVSEVNNANVNNMTAMITSTNDKLMVNSGTVSAIAPSTWRVKNYINIDDVVTFIQNVDITNIRVNTVNFVYRPLKYDGRINETYQFVESDRYYLTGMEHAFTNQNNLFNLERKYTVLRHSLLWHFVYLNLKYDYYWTQYVNDHESYSNIRKFIGESSDSSINEYLLHDLMVLHRSFSTGQNYVVDIFGMQMPWNDRVLTSIALSEYEKNKIIETTTLANGDSKALYDAQPNFNVRIIEPLQVTLWSVFNRSQIRKIAQDYLSLNMTNDLESLETQFTQQMQDRFLNMTLPMAPIINGTACVGKSTLINGVLKLVRTSLDASSDILKAGCLGSFVGKDCNQVLAMECQGMMLLSGLSYYTSLMDRCPFNNLIWRFIMQLVDSTQNTVDLFMKALDDLSPYLIMEMSKLPCIYIVDNDVVANRQRMFRRNDSKGDCFRCLIENYTPVQNMVYGVFGYMCQYPVFNHAGSYPLILDSLVTLLHNKIECNINANGKRLPMNSPTYHKLIPSHSPDNSEKFQSAIDMGIFK